MSAFANEREHLLSTLTDEERAAIEAPEDDQEALARIAAGADDEADDDRPGDEDDDSSATPEAKAPAAAPAEAPAAAPPAPAPAPAAQAPAAAPAASEPAQAPAAEPAPTPAPAPQPAAYRAELPADHAQKMAATKAELTALRDKFKAGDLELDAYEAERERVTEQLDAMRRAEVKAEIAREMTHQTAEAQWANAIQRQFQAAKQADGGGIDYAADEAKRNDLDTFVRALGAKAENADKSMDWFMSEAHKRVLALHDIKPAGKAPATAPSPAPAMPNRKPPVASVTPSLTNVPGADGAGDVGDEFGNLDALEGLEYEAAIARLSPSQREKYLAGA
jgi:hypothetical protein